MSFDAFLIFKEPGAGAKAVEGETLDRWAKDHKAFEIESFDFGCENTLNIGSKSGGAGAGKAQFKDFTVEKQTDKGSPNLFLACCNGGHFGLVELVLRRAGGDSEHSGEKYLKFSFKLVAVKDINWSGSDGDDVCKETVIFEYGAIKIEYHPQEDTGGHSAAMTQMWSRTLNENSFDIK